METWPSGGDLRQRRGLETFLVEWKLEYEDGTRIEVDPLKPS